MGTGFQLSQLGDWESEIDLTDCFLSNFFRVLLKVATLSVGFSLPPAISILVCWAMLPCQSSWESMTHSPELIMSDFVLLLHPMTRANNNSNLKTCNCLTISNAFIYPRTPSLMPAVAALYCFFAKSLVHPAIGKLFQDYFSPNYELPLNLYPSCTTLAYHRLNTGSASICPF